MSEATSPAFAPYPPEQRANLFLSGRPRASLPHAQALVYGGAVYDVDTRTTVSGCVFTGNVVATTTQVFQQFQTGGGGLYV